MEDYKQEIQNLLLKYYQNTGKEDKMIQRTTSQILEEVRGVIPQHPVDEHDIYQIMKGLFFEQDLKIVYEKICTFEGDIEKGIPAEYEKVEAGRFFVWNLYENRSE